MPKRMIALCLARFLPAVANSAVYQFGANLLPSSGAALGTYAEGVMPYGDAHVLYNDSTGDFTWSIFFTNLSSPVGGAGPTAHIHQGAAGTSGPVVIALDSSNPGTVIDGTGLTEGIFLGATTLESELVAPLFSGELYINIHTTNFPGGEIRGQILPAKITVIPLPAAAWLMLGALASFGVLRHYRGICPACLGEITQRPVRAGGSCRGRPARCRTARSWPAPESVRYWSG